MDILNLIVASLWLILSFLVYRKVVHPDGMDTFRAYLKDVENWQYEHSFEKTIWRYLKNVDYEFEVRSHMKWESENEPWMPEFFDNQRYREEVRLYVKGKLVEKNLFFVSFDGGRFLVPEPEIWPIENNDDYLWRKDSLKFLLNKIIGTYPGGVYPGNIYEFSERYNISII